MRCSRARQPPALWKHGEGRGDSAGASVPLGPSGFPSPPSSQFYNYCGEEDNSELQMLPRLKHLLFCLSSLP